MSKTVLFAGGPLHGKTIAVPDSVRSVNASTPPGDLLLNWTRSPDDPIEPDYVRYSVTKLAIFRRIVWIGYLGLNPDEDLVFEVLASDGAKAASVSLAVSPA